MVHYFDYMVKTSITEQVATTVAAAITRADVTKRSVSRTADIPYTTLTRKLNGHGEFNAIELFRIAKSLGVSPASLLPEIFHEAQAA